MWDYPIADWDRVIDVNLNGVFYCNRAVVPHMLRNDYGRIVNIASIAGKEGNPNAAAYSASKAGVIGLTKSLGKELANTNVRVNCVTPAAVRTPLFDQMTQEQIDWMLSKIPLGRFGEIDEIASLVLLAGERGMQLLHRRRVRHLRRPRDVLNRDTGMDNETLAFTPAVQLAEMIRQKQLSPVELMTALLARIEALNPRVNAFAYLAADAAMDGREARRSGADEGRAHRPAARRARHHQGPGDHQGHADADGQPHLRRQSAHRGHAHRAAPARRRRDHPRQDHDIGVRLDRRQPLLR